MPAMVGIERWRGALLAEGLEVGRERWQVRRGFVRLLAACILSIANCA